MTSGGLASIHYKNVAIDVSGGVGSKKNSRAFQVMVGAETTGWNVAEQVIPLVLDNFVRHVRGKPSWCNRIDLDIMPRPLHRKIVRKRNYSAFAGMVSNCLHRLRRRASDARD
jgi:hypothetical protein